MWYHWISRKVLHAYNGHTRKGLKINTKRINEAVLIRSKQTVCKVSQASVYPSEIDFKNTFKICLKNSIFPRYMVSPELALYYTTIYRRSISVLPFTNSSDTHQASRLIFASYSSMCAPAACVFWADKCSHMHQGFDDTFATMNTSAAGGVLTAPTAEMLGARNASAVAMAPLCS